MGAKKCCLYVVATNFIQYMGEHLITRPFHIKGEEDFVAPTGFIFDFNIFNMCEFRNFILYLGIASLIFNLQR